MAGETGSISVSMPIAMTIAGFFAISFYNFVYINIKIFATFKRRRGLYFWSLLVASWGIPVHATGFLLKFFELGGPKVLALVFVIGGWYCMVTGQSVVLYSRLHLVVMDPRKIRWILIMIIVDFFLFHVVMTVFFFGANLSHPETFIKPFNIYEKIQVTAFALQEFVISGLYIRETWKMLKPAIDVRGKRARKIMIHLIVMNATIIIMDITMLGTEYANQYEIQTTYKGALYSIKLVMEFSILNQLFAIVKGNHRLGSSGPTVLSFRSTPFDLADNRYGVAVTSNKRIPSNNESSDGVEFDSWRGIVKATEVTVETSGKAYLNGDSNAGNGAKIRTQEINVGSRSDGNDDDIEVDIEAADVDPDVKRSTTPTSSEMHFAQEEC